MATGSSSMMVKPFIVWSSSIDSKSTDSYLIDIIETFISAMMTKKPSALPAYLENLKFSSVALFLGRTRRFRYKNTPSSMSFGRACEMLKGQSIQHQQSKNNRQLLWNK